MSGGLRSDPSTEVPTARRRIPHSSTSRTTAYPVVAAWTPIVAAALDEVAGRNDLPTDAPITVLATGKSAGNDLDRSAPIEVEVRTMSGSGPLLGRDGLGERVDARKTMGAAPAVFLRYLPRAAGSR
jgi:hypothetical protein